MTLKTELGTRYQGNGVELVRGLDSDSSDMIFADPPLNLNKLYPSSINDNLKTERYLEWRATWLSECIRLLKHGGSLFPARRGAGHQTQLCEHCSVLLSDTAA